MAPLCDASFEVISRTTGDNLSSKVSKCSARCPESNDVSHGGVGHFRRELDRSGQVRVGSGHVWYQNVQLEELNPLMYQTWGCEVGNLLRPISPD